MEETIDNSSQINIKTKVKEPVPKGAWAVLIVIWLVCIAAPLNMFKPSTIAPELISSFGITGSSFGWIMSVFSIMGLILAFPASGIVYKLGLKASFLISGIALVIGSVMGALAPNYTTLLISRIIEGCGMGFIGVAAPTAISLWFPQSRRAFAISVYQTWMPFGTLISMNLSPLFAGSSFTWRGMWWFAAAFSLIVTILFAVIWKEPPVSMSVKNNEGKDTNAASKMSAIFRNPSVWILSLSFLVFSLTCTGTTSSYWSLYMRTAQGINPSTAAFCVSLCTVLGAVGVPLGGWVSDKIKSRKIPIMIGWIVVFVFLIFAFQTGSITFLFVLAIVNGLFQGWVPSTLTTAATEVLDNPGQIGLCMGLTNTCRNLGNVLGGMALGYLYTPLGWATGSHVLCLPPIVLIVVLFLVVCRKSVK